MGEGTQELFGAYCLEGAPKHRACSLQGFAKPGFVPFLPTHMGASGLVKQSPIGAYSLIHASTVSLG